jgi:hypothetical protein
MLTLSVLWVVLAGAITVLAMLKRSRGAVSDSAQVQPKDSDDGFALLGIVSCLVLLAGFLYVGRFLVAGL